MIRRPQRSTRTDTLLPYTTLFRSRPVVLVTHGGLIAALTAALLGLPVDNWPILGGMGNCSWVQLSAHSELDAAHADIRWRLDVWNASARSEEHTSELQSLMRSSYAVFCLKKKKKIHTNQTNN